MADFNHDKFKRVLIQHLMSELLESDLARLKKVLANHRFTFDDVSFAFTKNGKTLTSINRWPWEGREDWEKGDDAEDNLNE